MKKPMKKPTTHWTKLLLASALLIATPACKNDNTTSPSEKIEKSDSKATKSGKGFSSGLPKNKKIDQLTDDQKLDFLRQASNHESPAMPRQKMIQFTCASMGIVQAHMAKPQTDQEFQQLCIKSRDNCIENKDVDKMQEKLLSVDLLPKTCEATVAEAETCVDAKHIQSIAVAKSFPTCEQLSLTTFDGDALMELIRPLEITPPDCEPLAKKCPGFLTFNQPTP